MLEHNVNVIIRMRLPIDQKIPICHTVHLNKRLSKGAFTDGDNSNALGLKELVKNLMNILEDNFTLWHRDDGGDCKILVGRRQRTMDDSMTGRPSFHFDRMVDSGEEWCRVEGKIGHCGRRQAQSSGGSPSQ